MRAHRARARGVGAAVLLGASDAASMAGVSGLSVVEQALSLQPFELLERSDARLQALPFGRDTSSSAANETLFRFAIISDTHFWLPSTARAQWSRQSDEQPERDGLLVSDSDTIVQQLMVELSQFAASGGSFAVHAGDSVCGGGSFRPPLREYERGLQTFREQQRAAFGSWPVFHVPGNHDLDPIEGGLATWRRTLGSMGNRSHAELAYRALRVVPGWRLLLLDSMDGVVHDKDGHGHIGEAQLAWLAEQLEQSATISEQVILVMHQLLVSPVDESKQGGESELPSWLDWRGDFVDNRGEVLALLARYSHVRLSFHGHVHANTLTSRHGVAFVTNAAASEYPMQWREVTVRPCELQIRTRSIQAPVLFEKSRLRDTRAGRNQIKVGTQLANAVSLRTC